MASLAYWLQVGVKRHTPRGPSKGRKNIIKALNKNNALWRHADESLFILSARAWRRTQIRHESRPAAQAQQGVCRRVSRGKLCAAAGTEYIIHPAFQFFPVESESFPKKPLDAVTHHRAAQLFGYDKPQAPVFTPRGGGLVPQDKAGALYACAASDNSLKIVFKMQAAPSGQALAGHNIRPGSVRGGLWLFWR